MCVQLAVAYFAYLRWAVTVPHGGGYTAPTGPAALPPHGPGSPASVHTLRPGTKCHTLPLVAPLAREEKRYKGYFGYYAAELSHFLTTKKTTSVQSLGENHNNMQLITAENS